VIVYKKLHLQNLILLLIIIL